MSLRLAQDFRFGSRLLVRSPVFTAIVVLTLGLGIGSNTAIFTVAEALVLRPLPYWHPERLALIATADPSSTVPQNPFSWPRFRFMLEHNRSFSGMAAFVNEVFAISGNGPPELLASARVSGNFFHVLGVRPELGRGFLPDEDRPGGNPVVLISHRIWQQHFSGRRDVLGQSVTLDSRPYTIVGVTAPGFGFAFLGNTVDVWAPKVFELNITTPDQVNRGAQYLNAVGRLRPQTTMAQAKSEMEFLARRYVEELPGMADADPKLRVVAEDLHKELVGNLRPALLILFGAVALVLLIACANVASLLLSRAVGRRKEFAVRIALGANRSTIVFQLLTESILLALCGGALGVLLSYWGIKILAPLAEADLPRVGEIQTNGATLLFSLAVSLLTGVLFGLTPALQIANADVNSGLREESRGASSSMGHNQLRASLVIAQVALSMILLIGTGLLIRSFIGLLQVRPGVDASNVLTMNITLPPARYGTNTQLVTFFNRLLDQAPQMPGVRSAAISSALPLNPSRFSPVLFEGQPRVTVAQRPLAVIQTVSPRYFETVRAPLLAGRNFTEHDDAQATKVAIVNESLARRIWPNASAVAKHMYLGIRNIPVDVVGVARDVKNVTLTGATQPEVYLPYPQLPTRSMNLLLRSDRNPHGVALPARRQVEILDRDLPVTAVQTMEEVLAAARAGSRATTLLLGVFSAMALLLAVVGIYGAISYSVAQRTQELGIRVALGAERNHILMMVIGHGLKLTLIGIALGLIAATALTRLLASLLYNVTTRDPLTFFVCGASFVVFAVLASYFPARQAMRIDATAALRSE